MRRIKGFVKFYGPERGVSLGGEEVLGYDLASVTTSAAGKGSVAAALRRMAQAM